MRLLYFYRGLVGGTQGVHIHSVIRALEGLGHQVSTCFPYGGGREAEETRVSTWRGRVPRIVRPLVQRASDLRAASPLRRMIAGGEPDVIYERYAFFSRTGVREAQRAGLPIMLEVNNTTALLPREIPAWSRPWARSLEKRSFREADALVAITAVLRDHLISNGVSAHRVYVLYNGVDEDLYRSAVSQRAERRAALGLEDRFVVACLQRWDRFPLFEPYIRLLKSVMREVISANSRVVFLFVGGGPLAKTVQHTLEMTGASQMSFLGPIPHREVPATLAAADVGLLPECGDFTCPLKLPEYMAAGLAVVAPDRPNVRELLAGRDAGRLFRPRDAHAMAEAIVSLAASPDAAARMGAAGQELALARYTWRANAEGIAQIARELLDVRHG